MQLDNGLNDMMVVGSSVAHSDETVSEAGGGGSSIGSGGDLRVTVAVRIRPFTEQELTTRFSAEPPPGTGPLSRSPSRHRLTLPSIRAKDLPSRASAHNIVISSSGVGSEESHDVDDTEPPVTVLEVSSDAKTITLHDPSRVTGSAERGTFTFDYVFSSLPPETRRWRRGNSAVALSSVSGDGGLRPRSRSSATSEAPSSRHSLKPLVDYQQADEDQALLFQTLALPLVDAAMGGFNSCIFAYGQTGSGKTYTMTGSRQCPGMTQRLCQHLFDKLVSLYGYDALSGIKGKTGVHVDVYLSYFEIYNEQVRDLLKQPTRDAPTQYASRFNGKIAEGTGDKNLKVRHHPTEGVYVEGLTVVRVLAWEECETYLRLGMLLRTQSSTAMNKESSRSHAIFQLQIVKRESIGALVEAQDVSLQRKVKMNLVDLAGSERISTSNVSKKRMKELNSINSSLSTLRRVIHGLAKSSYGDASTAAIGTPGASVATPPLGALDGPKLGARPKNGLGPVVPYRDSLLTYVLSDNLGGNSYTVMCANVSPWEGSLTETESTLRYATLTRSIVNNVKVNELSTAQVIREMKEKVATLQAALSQVANPGLVQSLEDDVKSSRRQIHELEQREEEYKAQLREHKDEMEQLQKTLYEREESENYWRREAEKQQQEVQRLRTAVSDHATHSGPPTKKVARRSFDGGVASGVARRKKAAAAVAGKTNVKPVVPHKRPARQEKDVPVSTKSSGRSQEVAPVTGSSERKSQPSLLLSLLPEETRKTLEKQQATALAEERSGNASSPRQQLPRRGPRRAPTPPNLTPILLLPILESPVPSSSSTSVTARREPQPSPPQGPTPSQQPSWKSHVAREREVSLPPPDSGSARVPRPLSPPQSPFIFQTVTYLNTPQYSSSSAYDDEPDYADYDNGYSAALDTGRERHSSSHQNDLQRVHMEAKHLLL